eukprot:TRINITY_DN3697_c0_g1_i7.p1 TRINITY_DN3697_c0_g1~~TRINITY_DN3697_c0_g1_i7.p1  ORF type:complete len:382 (+),score=58.39 TRINITY_DN3697_c0_g1_i7:62-1207(+)
MTQAITVQVGQCGNQIGNRFWDLALKEHAHYNKKGVFDHALSSFFRNVDSRYDDPMEIPVGNGSEKIRTLKARAVLIDMEEGVVNETMKGPLGDVYDNRQLMTDVSGSGNNWAHGFYHYGPKYEDEMLERLRRPAEFCDCLQSFFLMHSLGGGTGSGVGTYILQMMQDHFPSVYRFTTAVFPSADDDVITSPYNSILALSKLIEHSDCVLPVENQALLDICTTKMAGTRPERGAVEKSTKPFDSMNGLVAHLLLNLTSGMRFEGSLNVDLNEITMNLVPFPMLHFIVPSLSPLSAVTNSRMPPRRLDQMFSDVFSRDSQLIKADPKNNRYLACGLMLRGAVELSDVRKNIDKIKPNLDFVHWNPEGWKVGMCSVPSVNQVC